MPIDAIPFAPVRARLRRPRMHNPIVARSRLLTGLNALRPLTLVVAPAGYGKTTLLSAWLETLHMPGAWLTMDESDSDPPNFVRAFLAAVQTIFPDAGRETMALVEGNNPADPLLLGRSLANDLDAAPGAFVLVLDDYHRVRGAAVHSIISDLLRHPPLPLSLVISTRHDPPLDRLALRVRNWLTELRTRDLCFTPADTLLYLQQVLGSAAVNAEEAQTLTEETEGWIAAIYMAALYRRSHTADPDGAVHFQVNSRFTADFLAAEVLAQQAPGLQEFLVKTSILDQVCGPLSDAVTGGTDGQTQLEWLERNNHFVFALDDDGWFRYHHLLQRLLRSRLMLDFSPQEVAGLHMRASEWFARRDLTESALAHATAAGDVTAAVQLAARHRHHWMNQEQWQSMQRCLQFFDPQTIAKHPDLLLMQGWLYIIDGRVDACATKLVQVDRLLASRRGDAAYDHLQVEADVLRSYLSVLVGQPERVVDLIQAALEKIPPDWRQMRNISRLTLASALQMTGCLADAYSVLGEDAPGGAVPPKQPTRAVTVASCTIYWAAADLHTLLHTANRVLSSGAAQGGDESAGWGSYFAASVYYHWNDLEQAAGYLRSIVDQGRRLGARTFANVSYALALVHQAQGRAGEAREVIDAAVHTLRLVNHDCVALVEAFQAEIALRQGDLQAATQWAVHEPGRLAPVMDFAAPQLVHPKILLAQGTQSARKRAVALLADAHRFFAAIHNTRFLIEVLALEALCRQADGDLKTALECLGQALSLAEPGGFIRLFVDLGRSLDPLLAILAQREPASPYMETIRAVMLHTSMPPTPVAVTISRIHSTVARSDSHVLVDGAPTQSHLDAVGSLTPREIDVLRGLARRQTNNEIAHHLGISEYTVKQHTTSLYAKLHVSGRREVVARARALGILADR